MPIKRPIFNHAFRNANIESSLFQMDKFAILLKTRNCLDAGTL